jgi:hypothetical protein
MRMKKTLMAVLLAWSALALARGHLESMDLLNRIRPGVTTAEEVRQILGQPATVMRFPREGIETMEYEGRDLGTSVRISISIGSNGVVRDIKRMTQTGP